MKRFWALHKQDVFAALAILSSCFLFLFLLLRLYQADLNLSLIHIYRELCSLLFAQLTAVLIHGVTDITCLWIQTGMFLSLLFTIPALLAPVEQQSFRLVRATDP